VFVVFGVAETMPVVMAVMVKYGDCSGAWTQQWLLSCGCKRYRKQSRVFMPSPDGLCSMQCAVTYQGPHATPTGHAKVPGKSWLAFSDGPRNCIGMQVGQLRLGAVYNSSFMSTKIWECSQLASRGVSKAQALGSIRTVQHLTSCMHACMHACMYKRHKAMLPCFSACSLPTWTCARLQW
jgi:hypothetical protein